MGNSPLVLWLKFCAFTAKDPGTIIGWGTKIPQAVGCDQKKDNWWRRSWKVSEDIRYDRTLMPGS